MRLPRFLLRACSIAPGSADRPATEAKGLPDALTKLRRVFPDFDVLVGGRRVADFGSGAGWQAIALAQQAGAASVTGFEYRQALVDRSTAAAREAGVGDRVRFALTPAPEDRGAYDVVISQNSMEHFDDPAGVVRAMADLLAPGGRLLITFGAPWFAPWGSHTHFFTWLPWVNILFSERDVMAVRSRYRTDGATRYEAIEGGLNRMTVAKFERLLLETNLTTAYRRDDVIRGQTWLSRVPGLRELVTNNISVILRGEDRAKPPRDYPAGQKRGESYPVY